MIIREETLVTINSKNRVQKVHLKLEQNPINNIYTIYRITGQYGGKETLQPKIEITTGKVKRTVAEQASLQFNSLLKQYLDKGYTNLLKISIKKIDALTEEEIKNLLGSKGVSDQAGIPKPMLAKQSDQCSSDIWEKDWYCSRKLDGTRCLMYFKNGEIHTASRGGGNYDPATKHLRENKQLIEIFRQKPDLILDGELYRHGSDWPLQRISGTVRLKEWTPECGQIQYWIYDYVDTSTPFKDRLVFLKNLQDIFKDSKMISVIDHVKLTGYLAIKKEHDKYVQEGFEGLCARNPEREYGVNKRSALYLIKLKNFKDAEFEITGVKEGLRQEDMCFTLKTKDGKEFSAKPMGDANSRIYYLTHKDEFVGKFATCKYFYYSKDGVPTLPVFKSIRPSDE